MQHIDWNDPNDAPLDGRPVLLLIEATNRWDEPYLTAITAYFLPERYTYGGHWVMQYNSDRFEGRIKGWVEWDASGNEVGFPAIDQHKGKHLCAAPEQPCLTVIGPEQPKNR